MAKITELTDELMTEWKKWLRTRPKRIREVAKKFPPWELYLMKSTGQRVLVIGYDEMKDGSICLKVFVSAEFNFVTFERQVFGVPQEDIEPCELPSKDEIVGAMLTEDKDIEQFVDEWKKTL